MHQFHDGQFCITDYRQTNRHKLFNNEKCSQFHVEFSKDCSHPQPKVDESLEFRRIIVTKDTEYIFYLCTQGEQAKSISPHRQALSVCFRRRAAESSFKPPMNSKLLGLITVSLATSVLLAPTQNASAGSVDFQVNAKESRALVQNVDSIQGVSSASVQNQKVRQNAQATAGSEESLYATAASESSEPGQQNLAAPTAEVSNITGGLFVTLVFIAYILLGLRYRKHRLHRAAVLLQQIEMLERIWKMNPQR